MRIEHTAIYLCDLEGGREFFERYFSASANELYHNKTKKFRSYFLTFDGGSRLEIMNLQTISSISSPEPKAGYAHIAFSVGSKERVLELTERLRTDGYTINSEPRTTGDGYFESSVLLEGNVIEITV